MGIIKCPECGKSNYLHIHSLNDVCYWIGCHYCHWNSAIYTSEEEAIEKTFNTKIDKTESED